MTKIKIRAVFLLLFVLCAGCAAEGGGESSLHVPHESEYPVFAESSAAAESSRTDSYSLPEDSSVSEESMVPEVTPAEALLRCFPELTEEEAAKALSFFAFAEQTFGAGTQEKLVSSIAANGYTDAVWRDVTGNSLHVLRSLYLNEHKSLANVRLLSMGIPGGNKSTVMTFGGDICFADNYVVMQHLKTTENGLADCLAPEWFDVMQSADIAMLNNEFAISTRGEPLAGKVFTFRADPAHTALYQTLGVDFVTLANNHAFDYGRDAFYDTLDTLREYGIDYAGGGRNAKEAQAPFYYLVDGRKIAYISATRAEKYILTPEAGEDSPGVFRCYDTARLLEVIRETKENCDYVVLFVHWGKEGYHELEDVQEETSHLYIDAGADLIIGSHAHRLQGIEFYKGKAIFYNLGNFWFDSYDIETGLVKLELGADGSETFYFLPGMQSGCVTSYELGTETGRQILDHVESHRKGISIADDGLVTAE